MAFQAVRDYLPFAQPAAEDDDSNTLHIKYSSDRRGSPLPTPLGISPHLPNAIHWRNHLSLCSSFPLRFNSLGLQTKMIETQRKGGAEDKSTEIYLTALGEGAGG